MLELRPVCENCNKSLLPAANDAMICSFECTFCAACVDDVLKNVCPNCGGGFVPRPFRPKGKLEQYPPSTRAIYKPVDLDVFAVLQNKYQHVPPEER
jgi:hypothetical protein